jgi:hypothetical protein
VTFGAWQRLDAAAVPDAPGVLQARADGVITYPRGKSAMLLYAASDPGESLRAFVAGRGAGGLARAAAGGARWVRFAAASDPAAALATLLARFVDRFGTNPAANAVEDPVHG